ncbi:MAG: hypothetical protein RIS50_1604, partial [Bacteroidota bacterium]
SKYIFDLVGVNWNFKALVWNALFKYHPCFVMVVSEMKDASPFHWLPKH